MVLLASPNNPTGTALPLADIEAIVAAAPGMVVVDEAYGEFRRAGVPSALDAAAAPRRGWSSPARCRKAFALAGGRLGYLAASPAVVDAVRIVRLPYHLSAVTQAVARVALAHAAELLGRGATSCAPSATAPSTGCARSGCRPPTPTPTSCCSARSPTGTPSGRACSTAAC